MSIQVPHVHLLKSNSQVSLQTDDFGQESTQYQSPQKGVRPPKLRLQSPRTTRTKINTNYEDWFDKSARSNYSHRDSRNGLSSKASAEQTPCTAQRSAGLRSSGLRSSGTQKQNVSFRLLAEIVGLKQQHQQHQSHQHLQQQSGWHRSETGIRYRAGGSSDQSRSRESSAAELDRIARIERMSSRETDALLSVDDSQEFDVFNAQQFSSVEQQLRSELEGGEPAIQDAEPRSKRAEAFRQLVMNMIRMKTGESQKMKQLQERHQKIENQFAQIVKSVKDRELTYAKFGFKKIEQTEDIFLKPIIESLHKRQGQGTMNVNDLWNDHNIKDMFAYSDMDKSLHNLNKLKEYIKYDRKYRLRLQMKPSLLLGKHEKGSQGHLLARERSQHRGPGSLIPIEETEPRQPKKLVAGSLIVRRNRQTNKLQVQRIENKFSYVNPLRMKSGSQQVKHEDTHRYQVVE